MNRKVGSFFQELKHRETEIHSFRPQQDFIMISPSLCPQRFFKAPKQKWGFENKKKKAGRERVRKAPEKEGKKKKRKAVSAEEMEMNELAPFINMERE